MAKLEDLFDIDFESSDNFFAYSKETFDFPMIQMISVH